MQITRRSFLKLSGAVSASTALGLDFRPVKAYADELSKMNRIKTSKQFTTICCYCSVGCGLISSVDKRDRQNLQHRGRSRPSHQ